jgi:hypothetical protein
MAVISKFRDQYGVTYFPRHWTHDTYNYTGTELAAVLPQPHSPFLVGWGPAVNNLAQLPTSFIPAAALCFREKKEISYPVPGKIFFFFCSRKVPTDSAAYPACIQLAPELQLARREADHWSQCSTTVKNDWSHISTTPYIPSLRC